MNDPTTEEAQREAEEKLGIVAEAFEVAVLTSIAATAAAYLKGSSSPEVLGAVWSAKASEVFNTWRNEQASECERLVLAAAEANDEWAERQYLIAGMDSRSWEEDPFVAAAIQSERRAAQELAAGIEWQDLSLRLADGTTVPLGQSVETLVRSAPTGGGVNSSQAWIAKQLAARGAVRVQNVADGRSYEVEGWARRMAWQIHNNTVRTARETLGKELGMDAVEVSAHMCCAPDHLPYQGKILTREKYESIQAALDRPLMGWNCRHHVWPCWRDSTPTTSSKELDKYRDYSLEEVEVDGKKMTRYEASQWLRSQERRVRELKTQAKVYDSALGEGNTQGITKRQAAKELTQKCRYTARSVGLPIDPSRFVVQTLII